MSEELIPIPRIESQVPNKNTIEWEIPESVSVCLMLIDKLGYTVLIKVKIKKKHWWNKSWKTFQANSSDPSTAIMSTLNFLEKYGFMIDHNTININEKVGRVNTIVK